MDISIELNTEDLRAMMNFKRHGLESPGKSLERRMIRAAIIGLIVYLAIPAEHGGLRYLAALFIFLGILDSGRRRAARQASRLSTLSGHSQTLRITEEGLRVVSTSGERLIFWPGVGAPEESPTHFFISIAEKMPLIVPKRAFASSDDCAAFIAAIKARTEPKESTK
jgi:hypothetical protein